MSPYGVIFFVLLSLFTSSKTDPCVNYSPLPFPYDRYVTNNISGSEVSVLHDRHIEEAWYRAGHSLDMPDTPPALLQCGTTFPVWMDGNIPNASDGEVERTACIVGVIAGNYNNCVHHLEIRVKNCGDYRVYRLLPTPSNDEAYCFGANKAEIDGDNSTYTSDHPTEETGNTSTVTVLPTEEETDETTLDPCSNYSPLPNAYDRYYYNVISGSSGSVLHDRHLVEGWYRAGLSLDMPTVAPSHLYCGTYFPVWLNGNLPNASEGIVERTACFLGNLAGNYCVHHLQIRVKDCGSYRVYYLYPTPSNDEAYCFGMEKIDTDGNKTTIPPGNTTNSPATAPPTEEETDDPPLDPCTYYSPLPNAYDRYYYNVINGSSGSVLHDRHLAEGWYRAGLSLDMPTVAPSHLYCGTNFPVWLNGSVPNISEGIVERTACFLGNQAGNYCVHHLQIRVKDCGSYRVYYLYPTPSNDEAYCFGMEKSETNATLPISTTPSPPTTTQIDPCHSYSVLPSYEYRYVQNTVNENSSFIQDRT
uniref:Uncharacterized protein LOC111129132 n=1 Tax=Crassostrea virginica TaxID=6565 RepID=A0A8B8DSY3_CRAVI|nr:uncharacterized protein LOC111129132 [Crassostrea virginica]